jgi:2-polyprenyl-6-hydroxyphenyl methylase/3-demethylubiquinone-9 3-methyltransferase
MRYIERIMPLRGARVLDVGCGGGILSEAMARAGAQVLGIDLAPEVLAVAELHALEAGVSVEYAAVAAEDMARQRAAAFDLVTCLELLEHVPDPAATVAALAAAVQPGGHVVVSTLNRTAAAFVVAIIGAEYVARVLPRGTHEYLKFIRPSDLARWGRAAGLQLRDLTGISYNPLTRSFRLSDDTAVNYLAHFIRPAL